MILYTALNINRYNIYIYISFNVAKKSIQTEMAEIETNE